ncbi:hypothetical protein PIB30_097984 [Stylosanthes scabra]|uniref:Sucrose synthase first GT-B domain-containing protein n=1 Tax=Stylosanthes scabra TaxID=79078 RepID=A0ABU6YZA1_9FABA|nr:hypothetical protein [Stylosanthes scabra]
MQERGLQAPQKSRHCLAPGTVKFAAFHVLSLEGGTRMTLFELAKEIQVVYILDQGRALEVELLIRIKQQDIRLKPQGQDDGKESNRHCYGFH